MGEQSSKHGPVQDDQLRREDQPDDDQILAGSRAGLAPGLTEDAVERRSEIARFLGIWALPGDRAALVWGATDNPATDAVLADLRRLPAGETCGNVQEGVDALGGRREAHRT